MIFLAHLSVNFGTQVSGGDCAKSRVSAVQSMKVFHNSSTQRVDHVPVGIVVEDTLQLESTVFDAHA